MENLGSLATNLLRLLLGPLQALLGALGLSLTDLETWTLVVAIFMVAAGLPGLLGDLALLRRRRHAAGTVVEIETDSDGARTPVIEFRDHEGQQQRMRSTLPTNRQIGDSARIIYDPLKPTLSREAGRPVVKTLGFFIWWGFAAGLLIFVFGPWR
ncbi:MAG: DUF3592 domain-containing protein [Devosia sp.]